MNNAILTRVVRTSAVEIWRYLATIAGEPCFVLYVIHSVIRGLFSIISVLMYSAEW